MITVTMNIFFNNGDKEEFEIDINNSTHLIKNSINYINFSE